ncbi:uncharacterized protein LOC106139006 [Amyelois transitella]|uniref:uncharacterized protein LOC106139006 n=1 Tax=Amyelois transitella TaxID=680683 RepID=UPI00067B558D|nr:uncharacterized protein LOC106139006 [Amyelois transitella]
MEDSINVDLDHMISLIEMRPMLWDKTSDDYKSRHLKTAAWHEICVLLLDNFECLTLHEQNEKGRAIIKKWTNEREKWMKWRKRHEVSGSSLCKKPLYYEQLSFLEKIFEPSNTSISEANETDSDPSDSKTTKHSLDYEMPEFVNTSFKSDTSQRSCTRKRKRSLDEFEVDLNSVKRSSTPSAGTETPMLSFFKGILPVLEEFDVDEHLEFQIKVLNLIRSMRERKKI